MDFQSAKLQRAVGALASQIAVSCSEARCKRFIPSLEGLADCVQPARVCQGCVGW